MKLCSKYFYMQEVWRCSWGKKDKFWVILNARETRRGCWVGHRDERSGFWWPCLGTVRLQQQCLLGRSKAALERRPWKGPCLPLARTRTKTKCWTSSPPTLLISLCTQNAFSSATTWLFEVLQTGKPQKNVFLWMHRNATEISNHVNITKTSSFWKLSIIIVNNAQVWSQ